jgi:hypothetical protein
MGSDDSTDDPARVEARIQIRGRCEAKTVRVKAGQEAHKPTEAVDGYDSAVPHSSIDSAAHLLPLPGFWRKTNLGWLCTGYKHLTVAILTRV